MMKFGANLKFLTNLNSRFSTVRFSSQLFVSRLSFFTTHEELYGMFSPFGEIKQARLAMDNQTGRPKGFGFVTFKNEADAHDAVKALDGRFVKGRLIFVEFANNSKTDGRHATSDS